MVVGLLGLGKEEAGKDWVLQGVMLMLIEAR